MKKSKKRPSVTKALMWRIAAIILGLWFVTMMVLTLIVADEVYYQYTESLSRYMGELSNPYIWYQYDSDKGELTNKLNYTTIISNTDFFYVHNPCITFHYSDLYLDIGTWLYPVEAKSVNQAVVVFDKDGQPIIGKDGYAYVSYQDAEGWFDELPIDQCTRIDMNANACSKAVGEEWGSSGRSYGRSYRLTGYFEGDEFVLADAAWYDWQWDSTLNSMRREYDYADIGGNPLWDSFLKWNDMYDGPLPEGKELVDIYVGAIKYDDYNDSVTINGRDWKLEDLAEAYVNDDVLKHFWGLSSQQLRQGASSDGISEEDARYAVKNYSKDNRFETVIVSTGIYYDEQGNQCPYAVVFSFQPLKVAMLLMLQVYFFSLLPLIPLFFLVRRRIREDLSNPVKHIMNYARKDYAALPDTVESDWLEIYELEQGYVKAQKDIHEYRKQINQLNTALDYAHNAEENRRLMVSNITHELKTPLAVIHSYAEGLKEGIAADKQEHYLDVILEEAQRMDGMVLEMLDLSRLEAGKVRLATDRFSLLELTKRVIDKLSLLVEEKELTVEYIWAHDCEITADESRITQAVTNLVSNAIKYSPRGSTVHIGVTRVKNQTMFSIENQSEPLSEEALSKIWDSFYRTDKSRTEKGTGLGLPITKAIIELHGGSCHVSNTKTGVEFKFYLP